MGMALGGEGAAGGARAELGSESGYRSTFWSLPRGHWRRHWALPREDAQMKRTQGEEVGSVTYEPHGEVNGDGICMKRGRLAHEEFIASPNVCALCRNGLLRVRVRSPVEAGVRMRSIGVEAPQLRIVLP